MPTEVRHVIAASGGDYTSLGAWITAQARNLVSADEIAIAECRNFDLAQEISLSSASWTTDATRYIKIEVPQAYRHDGRSRAVSGTGFRLIGSVNGTLTISAGHVVLEGLNIQNTGTGANAAAIVLSSGASVVRLRHCIIHNARTGSNYTIQGSVSGLTLEMFSCITYGYERSIDTRSMASANLAGSVFWRHADQLGVLGDTELVVRNSYAGKASGSTEDWWTGGAAPSGNNNASSGTTATTDYTSSINGVAGSAVFVSVTAGSEDFHLKSGSNALVGAGANLTATFTTDIDGDTWPASGAWDIGADYRDAGGGGSSIASILGNYKRRRA